MHRRVWLGLLLGVSSAVACGSDDKPPGLASADGGGTTGSLPRSGSSNGDAGAEETPGNGGADGVVGGAGALPIGEIGGEGVYASGGAPPDVPASCDRGLSAWQAVSVEGISTPGADELLLSMTHDELTLVFSRGDALFVSDRSSATAAFGTPVAFTLPAAYAAARGVALAPDGQSLVVVAADGTSFLEIARVARSGGFDREKHEERFGAINDARMNSGDTLSSPALSADGKSFYYTARKGDTQADVWLARGEHFEQLTRKDHASLGTDVGKAKLVVSVSADERTLFVFDEALGYVSGLWSITPRAELTQAVPFEGFESLFVNSACDRSYGSLRVGDSLDVVVTSPK